MGLEAVELLLSVEEEFKITISESEAEKMPRVGDLYAYVVKTLREGLGAKAPGELEIWHRLKALIVAEIGVRPEEVTLEARFAEDLDID